MPDKSWIVRIETPDGDILRNEYLSQDVARQACVDANMPAVLIERNWNTNIDQILERW